MSNENLKQRTKRFALSVIELVESLPQDRTSSVLGRQLLRAGTAVGGNYRAACRAKSTADFISKMGTVEEEADESAYWLELLEAAGKLPTGKVAPFLREADELTAIAVASICTAKQSLGKIPQPRRAPSTPHSALRTPHSTGPALRTPHRT